MNISHISLSIGRVMHDLNRNEVEVLRILWDRGASKPAEVQAEFGWAIENATLRSVLSGLVEKGLLVRTKRGRAFYYRPRVTRRSQLRRTIRRMADVFTGGSTGELVLELIRSEKLAPEELAELQRVAAGKPSRPGKNNGGGDD